MTDRLSDIKLRLNGFQQLGAVVNAMRGIAAARVQQSLGQLAAVETYSATLRNAIGCAIALAPPVEFVTHRQGPRTALVLFCAEQGFAGAFSERILEAATHDLPPAEIFLIGTRGAGLAAERSIKVDWSGAMPSQSGGIPKLADQIAEMLYGRLVAGGIDRLDTLFSRWQAGQRIEVQRRQLFPLDMKSFPHSENADAPLLNLSPEALLSDLTSDYIHAQLCDAALHAFAAENQARMETMTSAHSEIDRHVIKLQAKQRIVRQEEITAEIIELAAGEAATRIGNRS